MLGALSFFCVLLAVLGVAAAHFGVFSPYLGAQAVGAAIALQLLFFLLALLGLFRGGARNASWLCIFAGLAALGAAGALVYAAFAHPIHDISTDIRVPPQFQHPIFPFSVERGGEYFDKSLQLRRDYDPALGATQARMYPDLEGMSVLVPADEVYAELLKTFEKEIPGARLVLKAAETRHAEYEFTSRLFRFVDDVVAEVRPGKKRETRIELRSRSRVGVSDLGANARRIRDIQFRLKLALEPLVKKHENDEDPAPAAPASATPTGTSTATTTETQAGSTPVPPAEAPGAAPSPAPQPAPPAPVQPKAGAPAGGTKSPGKGGKP